MSGHSKWATIKRAKAKEDAKRGKAFTKISKEISVASREGGDPAMNAKLRLLIEKAKEANMPHDNITRAIKRGTGELGGGILEAASYEGYGPAGIAIIVETLSDNKNRTVADVRHLFTKMGGNLGETGSVGWMFSRKGVIEIEAAGLTEDAVIEKLLDYNIEDVSLKDSTVVVSCEPHDLEAIKKEIKNNGWKVLEAEVELVAKDLITLSNQEQEEKVYKLLEALEELDDVQNVYANVG